MVRPICKDVLFLKRKSIDATPKDKQIIIDLMDTLKAYQDECVGMAANMIGENKRVIIAHLMFYDEVFVNPEIVEKADPYETEESCLSLVGKRKVTRYNKIRIKYLNTEFKSCEKEFSGFNAQIIQHECDHLEGIII